MFQLRKNGVPKKMGKIGRKRKICGEKEYKEQDEREETASATQRIQDWTGRLSVSRRHLYTNTQGLVLACSAYTHRHTMTAHQ